MKPWIGINLDIDSTGAGLARVGTPYYDAIERAGGIPVLIPPLDDGALKELLSGLDGLMLIGGLDYRDGLMGQAPDPNVSLIDSLREDFDRRLTRMALNQTRLPMLGICGGHQRINIDLGGPLIQHIDSFLPGSTVAHRAAMGSSIHARHPVTLEKPSRLYSIYQQDPLDVVTSHHQAVRTTGSGLVVNAKAADGIIEGIELPGERFVIGVQWHPERDFATNRVLFEAFIAACRPASAVTTATP